MHSAEEQEEHESVAGLDENQLRRELIEARREITDLKAENDRLRESPTDSTSGTGAAAPDADNTKNRNGCSRSLNGVVMPDMEQIAGELYELYCAEVGGKAYNGDPLPKWDAFRADPAKRKQSDAWVKVAEAAFDLAGHASLAAKRAEA